MKKSIIIFSVLALAFSVSVNARQKGIHEAGTGLENSEIKEAGQETVSQGEEAQNQKSAQIQTQNQGEEAQIQIQSQIKAGNIQELRTMMQNKKEELKKSAQEKKEKVRAIYQNQNKVREAVHAMLAMGDMANGIGQEISQIAREFNNSVDKTIQAEEKIQNRNRVLKFFLGGDEDAAVKLDEEISKNQERIKELKKLQSECACDEELKEILKEQVDNLEDEQERLQKIVIQEKQNKGLIGTIISWFK